MIIIGQTWICASKTKASCLILKPSYTLLCFQRLYCFVMIAKDFYPQSTWKHIVIPSLTFHPNCCLDDCACLGCYSSMAHLETKSRGCHGSARIDGVLKRQNDKHRADVPWDSNPACLWQFHMQMTKHVSSGNRCCSTGSLTFLLMKKLGPRLIKAKSWLLLKTP